jgi:hypothetical protein
MLFEKFDIELLLEHVSEEFAKDELLIFSNSNFFIKCYNSEKKKKYTLLKRFTQEFPKTNFPSMRISFLSWWFNLKEKETVKSNTLQGKYNIARSIAKYEAPEVIGASDNAFSGIV